MIITGSLVDCYASLNIRSLERNLWAWTLRYKHLDLTSKLFFLDSVLDVAFRGPRLRTSKAVGRAKRLKKVVSEFQVRTNNEHTCIEYLEGY